MQGDAERGETPVPDLTNLDTYYEIGVELISEAIEFDDTATYRKRYRDKLRQWDDFSPHSARYPPVDRRYRDGA